MKLLFSLIVLISIWINNVYGVSLLSLKTFQYDSIGCSKQHSSDSQGSFSGSGSFGLLEDNNRKLGSIDGGGVEPGSESSFESLCDNGELVSETFYRLDDCLLGWTFSIDYDNGTIKKEISFECGQKGSLHWFKPFECYNDCLSSPYMYTIIEMDDIEIPKETYVEIQYHGECDNNDWKKNFDTIKYTPLNQCFINGESSSYSLNCNSTTLQTTQSEKLNCLVYQDFLYTNILDQCTGSENYINICNK
ncbi:hypothetical protein RB653_004266 [Dictyostelium firmibasis]|uniref:Uncharacterized protein n=1 Tax=Dictyostelium firmibasis TaxID=79012 RepID=A0AAN7YXU7_9MYCE